MYGSESRILKKKKLSSIFKYLKSMFPTFRCSRFSNSCISKYKLRICVGTTCFKKPLVCGHRSYLIVSPLVFNRRVQKIKMNLPAQQTVGSQHATPSEFAKPVSLQIGRKMTITFTEKKISFDPPSKMQPSIRRSFFPIISGK